jgi:hypothetical protein
MHNLEIGDNNPVLGGNNVRSDSDLADTAFSLARPFSFA